ncbi:MAG TPA: lipoate--protein ligase family protein [Gemmataceae bacterium]|jgi:lipoate-protein ligase A|nr:lipoate--protein ligase family protein [Gemmataceae bacterium]
MRFLDRTMPTLIENLALDEALLEGAEAGAGDVLRFWEWPDLAVILGAGGQRHAEVDVARCRQDGVPIVRRASGGGTVLLGPGCLLYSLVLRMDDRPELADLRASYRTIGERMKAAFAEVRADVDGQSDLVVDGRKFSGNAQQRKRTHLLHHGTILHAFDLTHIGVYVKHPPRMPEYRQGRSHADFVTNVPMPAERIKAKLAESWQATETTTEVPTELVERLIHEKYGRDSWHERR